MHKECTNVESQSFPYDIYSTIFFKQIKPLIICCKTTLRNFETSVVYANEDVLERSAAQARGVSVKVMQGTTRTDSVGLQLVRSAMCNRHGTSVTKYTKLCLRE